jgi:hypothetical protein
MLSQFAGLYAVGASARRLLRRLLLGPDDTFVCGRGDECALDRAPRTACPLGETNSYRIVDRPRRRAGCIAAGACVLLSLRQRRAVCLAAPGK